MFNHPSTHIDVPFPQNVPVIDDDFDMFDVNEELELDLREAEIAHFHNDTFELSL